MSANAASSVSARIPSPNSTMNAHPIQTTTQNGLGARLGRLTSV